MTPSFPFELVLAFAFMGASMWVGVLLRAKIKFLQTFLVPASMIGGLLGMVLLNCGLIPVNPGTFHAIAYHLFIISFIAIGLSVAESKPGQKLGRQILQGSGWMAIINTFSMSTQILIGLFGVALLGLLGFNLHPNFGYLLSLGFTQGPGQALTFGQLWQNAGFADAVNLGLTFASLGFLFAFFLGVPLAYWGIKKGLTANCAVDIPEYVAKGFHREGEDMEVAGHLPMHSGNIDSLALQFGAVGVVYGLVYGGYYLFNTYVFATPITKGWGFFFAVALLVAVLTQFILRKCKAMYLIDQGLQRRISGWAVDYLVIATLFPISLPVVLDYIVPIAFISIAGGLWTLAFGYYFGRRISPLGFERMIAMYGANTGTMASGLLLLRIVDPQFKTTVNMECGSYVLLVFPTITLCLYVMSYAGDLGWGFGMITGVFAAISVGCLVLLKLLGMWQKPQPICAVEEK